MYGNTGISATRRIREIEANRASGSEGTSSKHATIVALTGMSSVEDRSRAFDAGVNS
jgi:CheY-like chemotaxis protein